MHLHAYFGGDGADKSAVAGGHRVAASGTEGRREQRPLPRPRPTDAGPVDAERAPLRRRRSRV